MKGISIIGSSFETLEGDDSDGRHRRYYSAVHGLFPNGFISIVL